MKTAHTAPRLRTCLLAGSALAALLTTSVAFGQTTGAAVPTDDETIVMSTFEVKTDKDYGYLKTNAATATRIGTEIQRAPMNISVIGEQQIRDTGLVSITDILRFTASGSPDASFTMRRPSNEATPQGNFTMRGFSVNSLLRNGMFRYSAYNLDNVERVEVVKGPAAVFFGQGYPGGVINYITKKPTFGKIPTTLSYTVDNTGGNKVAMDHNVVFNKQVAFRVVGAWTDTNGERDFEFRRNFNLTPSITYVPTFAKGKLRINLETEYLKESFNRNNSAWAYNDGWFQDYATTDVTRQNALLDAARRAYPATTSSSLYDKATRTTVDPQRVANWDWAHYQAHIFSSQTEWMKSIRTLETDPNKPLITNVSPYGYYTDRNGKRVKDENFNFLNRGAIASNEVFTLQGTVDFAPFPWLDVRYSYTNDTDKFDSYEGTWVPNADGITFNTDAAITTFQGNRPGYYRPATQNHQLDLVFKADFWGMKNKILTGFVFNKYNQNYYASSGVDYSRVPGYNYGFGSTAQWNPDGTPRLDAWGNQIFIPNLNPVQTSVQPPYPYVNIDVPINQVLRDRQGNVLSPQRVYSYWDPSTQTQPDISKIFPARRNLVDRGETDTKAYYINYQTQILQDKLTFLAGYRKEERTGNGQDLIANDPWFSNPPDAYLHQDIYPPDAYNYDPTYAGRPEAFRTRSGDSWMVGASYAITPEVSVYATVSKTFKINTGLAGDYNELTVDQLLQDALTHGGGQFTYTGHGENRVIHSIAEGRQLLEDLGANKSLSNEDGMNYEAGVKVSAWDNKLVSTLSLFRGVRNNQKLDDSLRITAKEEPFNYSTTMFAPTSSFYGTNKRNFRWRTTGVENKVEGVELDVIWTPIRNFQAIITGAWLWTAKTVNNPIYPKGSGINADLVYNTRLENVPEYRLNAITKYTFTKGFFRNGSVGVNGRYSSETIVNRTIDYNPFRGGAQAGDYLIFDANVSYPWEMGGLKFNAGFYVSNLTDKTYYEGAFVSGDHRTWTLRLDVAF